MNGTTTTTRGADVAPLSVPPSDTEPLRCVEMEQACIGAMLMLDDGAVSRGMRLLHVRHFPGAMHQTIFRAICRLARKRDAGSTPGLVLIDLISVGQELQRSGELGRDVRGAYLSACVQSCPSAANLDYYADSVIYWSKLRHLRALGEELAARIALPDAKPDKLANAARNATDMIQTHGHADITAIFDKEK